MAAGLSKRPTGGGSDLCGALGFPWTPCGLLARSEDLLGRKPDQSQLDGSLTCWLSWVCRAPDPITRVTEQVRLCVSEKGTEFFPIGPFLSLVSGKVENLKVSLFL